MKRLALGDTALRMRIRDEGPRRLPGRGPEVVCVHGAGATSLVWLDLLRTLSRSRRVVAPDLPGHGQSDPWRDAPSIELYRDAVGTACALLGLSRVAIVGHSMGGLVALACAAAWPERVAGLILIGCGLAMPPSSDQQRAMARGQVVPLLGELGFSSATPAGARPQLRSLAFSAGEEAARADLAALSGFDASAIVRAARAPTLLLHGADDLLVPLPAAQALQRTVCGAQLALVPEAGHLPLQEQPGLVAGEVSRFLDALA
jgi:pimeloyl-ACP methyl ester carboxylesterase